MNKLLNQLLLFGFFIGSIKAMQIKPLHKIISDLQRFGLRPLDIFFRLTNGSSKYPKLLINSIPKAGTHLLERAIILHRSFYRKLLPTLTEENIKNYGGLESVSKKLTNSQIILAHLTYSKLKEKIIIENDIKCIFTIRDPRDILVSDAYHLGRQKKHRLYHLFKTLTINERINLLLRGDDKNNLMPFAEFINQFLGWLNSKAYVVKFEDLVINSHKRETTINNIYEFLGIILKKKEKNHILDNLISSASPTYRAGGQDRWSNYFSKDSLYEMSPSMTDVIENLGYKI